MSKKKEMKKLKFTLFALVALVLLAFSDDQSNPLIGEWELKQFVVKDLTVFYRGVPDSSYNQMRNYEFETEIKRQEAVMKFYNTVITDKLEFKKAKARSSFYDNQKNLKWWKYTIVKDSIFTTREGVKRNMNFKLNEDKSELTLIEELVKTVWSKKK